MSNNCNLCLKLMTAIFCIFNAEHQDSPTKTQGKPGSLIVICIIYLYQDFTLYFDCTIIVTSQMPMSFYFRNGVNSLIQSFQKAYVLTKVLF